MAPLKLRIELEILGAFVKFQKATVSFFMSVRPSARMEQLGYPLYRFRWNLVFEYFSKIYRENSNLIKIVRPSSRMEQLGYHCTDFDGIWRLSIFRKYIERIQI